MKAILEKKVKVFLEMDEIDARFLISLVQNPIAEDEGQDFTDFRARVFSALNDAGIRLMG